MNDESTRRSVTLIGRDKVLKENSERDALLESQQGTMATSGFPVEGRAGVTYEKLLEEAVPAAPEIVPDDEPVIGIIFFGFVTNLAMNYLLQEVAYFKSSFGDSFGSLCTMIYAVCNIVGQVLVLWKGSSFTFGTRLTCSGLVLSAVLLCVPVLTMCEIPFKLGFSLILIGTMGFCVAIYMSAAMGLTGMLSDKVRNYFSVGMSLPGLSAWPIMLGLDLVFEKLLGLSRTGADGLPSPVDTATTLALMSIAGIATFASVVYYLCGLSQARVVKEALTANKAATSASDEGSLQAIAPVLPMALALFNVFFVTFIVVPDQVTSWKSSATFAYPGGEFGYQNLNYYMFQIFDFVGRTIVAVGFTCSPLAVGIGSLSRSLFLPFFFLASYKVSIFDYDLVKFGLTAVFATTYGILLTLGLQHGPAAVTKNKAATAGYIMSFALTIGIFMGSCFALGIQYVPIKLAQRAAYNREIYIDPNTLQFLLPTSTPSPTS